MVKDSSVNRNDLVCCDGVIYIYIYIPTYAIGPFHVAFQSPSNVFLVEGGPAVPLYCIASNHSLQHTYMWENSAGQLSPSTPVLGAIKPEYEISIWIQISFFITFWASY